MNDAEPNGSIRRFANARSALVVALGVRLFVGYVASALVHSPESAYEHRMIARSLAEGDGFRFPFFANPTEAAPTSQQAPFTPYLLFICFKLFGVETPASFAAMLSLQIVASVATVEAIGRIAEYCTVKDDREPNDATRHRTMQVSRSSLAGSAARWIAATYPPLVVAPFHVQALVWNLAAIAWMTAFASSTIRRLIDQRSRSFFDDLGFASAWGTGLLIDPINGAVGFALWSATTYWSLKSNADRSIGRFARPALILVGVVLLVVPWTLRNYRVHGRFVLIKDSFGYVFWQGNTAASRGTDKLLVGSDDAARLSGLKSPVESWIEVGAVRRAAVSVDSSLSENDLRRLLEMNREIDKMDWFRDRIIGELRARPAQYFEKALLRLKSWCWFDETNPRSFATTYRISYLGILAAAASGLAIGRYRRQVAIAPLVAAVTLTLVHVAIITSARFRISFEMLLILPFSGFLAELVVRLNRRRRV